MGFVGLSCPRSLCRCQWATDGDLEDAGFSKPGLGKIKVKIQVLETGLDSGLVGR